MVVLGSSSFIIDEFTRFATEKTYKINHGFDCNDKCLIYMSSCRSGGKQYVGNTTDHLEVDGITIKVMLDNLRIVTWKMSNKSFCKVIFYSITTKVFLKK